MEEVFAHEDEFPLLAIFVVSGDGIKYIFLIRHCIVKREDVDLGFSV